MIIKLSEWNWKRVIVFSALFIIIFYCAFSILLSEYYNRVPAYLYDLKYGNEIILDHRIELNLSDKNCYEKAVDLNKWLTENTINIYGTNKSHVRAYGPNMIGWFITHKEGACGEASWYFVKMLSEEGCYARVVERPVWNFWDHQWIEFFDENGTKYFVEPRKIISSNIYDFFDAIKGYCTPIFGKERCIWDNARAFISKDVNKHRKNISDEYLPYLKIYKS